MKAQISPDDFDNDGEGTSGACVAVQHAAEEEVRVVYLKIILKQKLTLIQTLNAEQARSLLLDQSAQSRFVRCLEQRDPPTSHFLRFHRYRAEVRGSRQHHFSRPSFSTADIVG